MGHMFCGLCGDVREAQVKTTIEADWATIRQVRVCLTCGHRELSLLPITQEPECLPAGSACSAS